MFELESFTTSFQNEDGTGILLVDKPQGLTSHDVVARVRRRTGIKRVGHAGTLDPLATGLLVVLVGRQYTKFQDVFLKQDKEYECSMELGYTTDSFDSDGQVTSTTPWEQVMRVTQDQGAEVIASFKGSQTQVVPVYSAVKIKGKKLYQFARQQQAVELPSRQVEIKAVELLSFTKDEAAQKMIIQFKAEVSSGTYIRSLAHDIGQKLGVGATVVALRRTKIGRLSIDQAEPLLS